MKQNDRIQLRFERSDFIWTKRYALHQEFNATSNQIYRDVVVLHVLGDLPRDFF